MINFFKRKASKKYDGEQEKPKENSGEDNDLGFQGIFFNAEEEDSNAKKMSFIDHLDELRKRILVVMAVFVAALIGFYPFHERIMHFLTSSFLTSELVYLEIMEPFLVNLKISFFCAVVAVSPLLAYQLAVFIAPVFSRRIKKYMIIILILFFILFAAGFIFAYRLLVPVAMKWLLSQGSNLKANLSVSKYVSFVGWFMVGGGIAFELPLILLFLIKAGILKVQTLRHQWRVVYIVILLLSAVITPDWSPVTMAVLAVPMILLYELSLLLAKVFK
ncbi:MAG: twin-arginine translocase subunit TatC [Candidatus Humimicrobiaceae bacterium]